MGSQLSRGDCSALQISAVLRYYFLWTKKRASLKPRYRVRSFKLLHLECNC